MTGKKVNEIEAAVLAANIAGWEAGFEAGYKSGSSKKRRGRPKRSDETLTKTMVEKIANTKSH